MRPCPTIQSLRLLRSGAMWCSGKARLQLDTWRTLQGSSPWILKVIYIGGGGTAGPPAAPLTWSSLCRKSSNSAAGRMSVRRRRRRLCAHLVNGSTCFYFLPSSKVFGTQTFLHLQGGELGDPQGKSFRKKLLPERSGPAGREWSCWQKLFYLPSRWPFLFVFSRHPESQVKTVGGRTRWTVSWTASRGATGWRAASGSGPTFWGSTCTRAPSPSSTSTTTTGKATPPQLRFARCSPDVHKGPC